MSLDRAWIESHIPHSGSMCLLDEVVSWDANRIRCRSRSHRALDNPLCADGRLGIACGIEYVAQAMAVHGALTALGAAPAAGLLVGLRGVRFHVARLDDVPGDLFCHALRVAADGGTALYDFELRSTAALLLSGRATIFLEAPARAVVPLETP